jgi:hypothetical protein
MALRPPTRANGPAPAPAAASAATAVAGGLRRPAASSSAAPGATATGEIPLPIQETLRDFLGALLGRGVAVDRGEATPPDPGPEHLVGHFRTREGETLAVCWADLSAAASCGAALAMVPATSLDEVERTGSLPEHLAENWYEVVNVLSGLLNSNTGPHMVLDEIHTADDCPPEVWAVVATPSRSRVFDVAVDGYAGGRIGLSVR